MYIQFNSTKLRHNIRYLRQTYRMTQKALAQVMEMDPYTLRCLELGKSLPMIDYDVLCRLSAFFDIGMEALTETELSLKSPWQEISTAPSGLRNDTGLGKPGRNIRQGGFRYVAATFLPEGRGNPLVMLPT